MNAIRTSMSLVYSQHKKLFMSHLMPFVELEINKLDLKLVGRDNFMLDKELCQSQNQNMA